MRKNTFVFKLLVLTMVLGLGIYINGCGKSSEVEVTTTTTTTTSTTTTTTGLTLFSLTSSAFINGDPIPNQYANTGPGAENTSVPLAWSNPPAGTSTYAITMHDPADPEFHWMVVNIPVLVSSLDEGASPSSMPAGSEEIIQYEGPNPPQGADVHYYTFRLWALNDTLDSSSISDWETFISAITPVLLRPVDITGTFDW